MGGTHEQARRLLAFQPAYPVVAVPLYPLSPFGSSSREQPCGLGAGDVVSGEAAESEVPPHFGARHFPDVPTSTKHIPGKGSAYTPRSPRAMPESYSLAPAHRCVLAWPTASEIGRHPQVCEIVGLLFFGLCCPRLCKQRKRGSKGQHVPVVCGTASAGAAPVQARTLPARKTQPVSVGQKSLKVDELAVTIQRERACSLN